MKKFLFSFGFQEPKHWFKEIGQLGWDQEDSMSFFITAQTEDEALQWGREVAEAFVRVLFLKAGWSEHKIPSWKDSEYAHWIETDLKDHPEDLLDKLPSLRSGEKPSFEDW